MVSASAISGSKSLIPDCLANLQRWKFQPNPQKTAVVVYEFKLDEGACHEKASSYFVLKHKNFAVMAACRSLDKGEDWNAPIR